jgi:hypothetical protein
MRYAQKPLAQPGYSFVHVPKARGDLKHSSLQRIRDREHFQTCMAEMLLLGKEAVRRRRHLPSVKTDSGAKPLSLEYLADRLDIDDPCFGFLVRTQECPPPADDNSNDNANVNWKQGMLQGFVTVTTFTNWQATLTWDSLHKEAYKFDPPALTKQRLTGERKWDSTGELAKEMQATVRCGDVWNEGIVWPRIAEISLLGGLGCGRVRALLQYCQLYIYSTHTYIYIYIYIYTRYISIHMFNVAYSYSHFSNTL